MISSPFVASVCLWFPVSTSLIPSSGGDRTDEQPIPAEAEGTSDGRHQG